MQGGGVEAGADDAGKRQTLGARLAERCLDSRRLLGRELRKPRRAAFAQFEAGEAPGGGVGERLVIDYRTQLDTDSQDGVLLTNVAGATAWEPEDGDPQYRRTLTDGTVGTGDHEDAHTVTVELPELRFEKSVMNVTTGQNPGTNATQRDTLRYRLYIENLSNVAIDDFSLVDELDALNADPSFVPGTLNVVSLPGGAVDNSDPNGGAAGTGLLDIDNLSIGGLGDSVVVEFEVELAFSIPSGTYVYNQSDLMFGDYTAAISDDPNLPGDEDPTRILVESGPPAALATFSGLDIAAALADAPDVAVTLALDLLAQPRGLRFGHWPALGGDSRHPRDPFAARIWVISDHYADTDATVVDSLANQVVNLVQLVVCREVDGPLVPRRRSPFQGMSHHGTALGIHPVHQ